MHTAGFAVYVSFRAYSQQQAAAGRGVEDLVREVWEFSRYYSAMALGQEQNKILGLAFKDLRELKVDVAYPFLMEVYRDYEAGLVGADEVHEIVRLVEAYVFRRAICAVPTNSQNKTFATLARELKKDRYLESVQAAFLHMKSYRRFPRDEEFVARIQERDLYNFRNRSYWLRKFENHDRKERVTVDDYTIEHILPQNENLSPEWRAALGEDWAAVQQKWLHTLGSKQTSAATPSLRCADNLCRQQPCQPHLRPPDVAVEIFGRRPAKRLDELAVTGVERVRILDMWMLEGCNKIASHCN